MTSAAKIKRYFFNLFEAENENIDLLKKPAQHITAYSKSLSIQ